MNALNVTATGHSQLLDSKSYSLDAEAIHREVHF